ncbi:uncharacterized protein LOC127804888 [Diospyros lotus]|uniref:uncharacterized protein LOC127804888 n=1 Tax=Diospyros lotus TaxID=55363 RepID=UPI00225694CF|nr:uncharacterized protein LOC127804888 [Diospyros lotus]
MADFSTTSATSNIAPSASRSALPSSSPISVDHHTLQITQHKLTGTNFREWSQSVMLVMKGKGKMGYLTCGTTQPDADTSEYNTWDAENSIVMAWIINSMEPKIGRTYLFYKIAKEVWDAVQSLYSDMENTAQCFEVRSALKTTRQGNNSVTDYYNILSELWHEMDLNYDINWEFIEDGVKYAKMVEKERVFDFLQGLNSDLDEVRGQLLGIKPFPSIKEAFAEVRREESRKKVMMHTATKVNNQGGSALAVSKQKTTAPRGDHTRDKSWCDHCKRPNHTKENCWKLHGKPANWKGRNQNQKRPQPAYAADTEEGTSVILTSNQLGKSCNKF